MIYDDCLIECEIKFTKAKHTDKNIFLSGFKAYAQRWEGKPGKCPSPYNRRRCVCNPQRHGCHSDYDCPGSKYNNYLNLLLHNS